MKLKRLIAAMVSAGMVASIIGATPVNFVSAVETPVFNTFDVNYDGWYNVGDTSTVTALPGGYNSSRAMLVEGRQTPEDGAEAQKGYYLGGGVKYNYSIFVKADTDEEFILTLRYLYPDETYGYETLAVKNVKAGEWTELKAVYTAPKDTVNLSPIISTSSTNDFWFDNFKVTTTTEKANTFEIDAALGDDGLKDVYANYFRVGTCVSGNYGNAPLTNSTVQGIILKHFNSITPENELKPQSAVNYNSSTDTNVAVSLNSASTIIDFCVQNNIGMRGHTLVWHSQTDQRFFKQGYNQNGANVSTTVMDQRMESFIKNMFQTISTQYPSLNLYAYDVVNEAMKDAYQGYSGNWVNFGRATGFYEQGNDYSGWISVYGNNSFITKAFTYADKYRDQYLKNMKLFYNDYNEYMGNPGGKQQAIEDMAKELFAAGVLDGVGMQAHLSDSYPSISDFNAALDDYLAIGCEVQITELDITGSNTSSLYKQIFQKAVNVSKSTGRFTALVVWGTTNNSSWRGDQGSSVLLFDNSGNGNANFQQVSGTAIVPQSDWGDGNSPKGGGEYIPPEPIQPDADGRFFFDTFETDAGDWANRDGGGEVTAVKATPTKAYDGTGALSVSGRTATWMGTSHRLDALAFAPGGTYKFGGAVMAPVDTNFQLSVYYSLSGTDTYVTIDTGSAAAGEWLNLEATVEIPTGATGAMVYFETEYFEEEGAGNLTDFYVDNAYGGIESAKSPLKDIEPTPTTTTTQATTTKATTTSTATTTKATTTSTATTTKATTTTVATTTKTVTTTKAPTTTTKAPAPETPDYGDIDRDGKVCDITDVVLLGKHISGKLTLPSTSQNYKNCNVNQTGSSADSVDVDDLKTVIDVMLGVDVSIPLK